MNKFVLKTRVAVMPADLETPVGIYLKIRDLYPESAILESSDYHASEGSVSIIGVQPIGRFQVRDEKISCSWPDGTQETYPAELVPSKLGEYVETYQVEGPGANILNGMLGFTAYDAVRYFDDVEIRPREQRFARVPDMLYVVFRHLIIVNHYKNELTIVENATDMAGDSGIESIVSVLRNNSISPTPFATVGDVESTLSPERYMQIVEQGINHARRGDVFQVVLSRRFSQAFTGDEFNVYRALRCINPSPYLFFFDFGEFKVFGSSPETHLKIRGNHATIDPIAGTFRRTGDDVRDHELAAALLDDAKENAEHIMLVDLARNDLARGGGKVEVEFMRHIQYYSHVIHMVSRVGAELPSDADHYRLLAGTFPAGTLSGAPKIRAMQIINDLEPHSRVTYGGCIGYLGFNGDINQAITIRSFLSCGNRLYSQAGAGIVARSNPAAELQETENKLGALKKAIEYASNF
ncbi:MAG: anthranilate synthase component I family protein [Muribaculum sp.]|nr:anthranilate synthase component I family protein [Muribaculaceae bacterium]MCM1081447.1 anthranilate synthase component I family protein [Muribaculum sp.]